MKKYINDNFNNIVVILLILCTLITLYNSLKPTYNKDLLEYKLDNLNKDINELKNKQKTLIDSIKTHKINIQKIDSNISKIRIEKSVINNYYELKSETIKGMNKREIDSSLRKRYKY